MDLLLERYDGSGTATRHLLPVSTQSDLPPLTAAGEGDGGDGDGGTEIVEIPDLPIGGGGSDPDGSTGGPAGGATGGDGGTPTTPDGGDDGSSQTAGEGNDLNCDSSGTCYDGGCLNMPAEGFCSCVNSWLSYVRLCVLVLCAAAQSPCYCHMLNRSL